MRRTIAGVLAAGILAAVGCGTGGPPGRKNDPGPPLQLVPGGPPPMQPPGGDIKGGPPKPTTKGLKVDPGRAKK